MNMMVKTLTTKDVHTDGDSADSPSVGLTSSALPEAQNPTQKEESSPTGVSTKNTLLETPQWYALRTTYGREMKAYAYLTAKGVTAFCPTIQVVKEVNGTPKNITQSRLPNIFFAYGTRKEMEKYVYDNVNLPFLRFYYRHFHEGSKILKTPLIVPKQQIESLRIICESEADDILLVPEEVEKFKTGEKVRVTQGKFQGVIGRVARYQGQQRVGIVIEDAFTITTAYLPKAFLENI